MFDFDYLKVDPGPFKDFLPEGSGLYSSPELPTVKIKRGKLTLEIPDLTFMHPTGSRLLKGLLEEILAGRYFSDDDLFSIGTKVSYEFEYPTENYDEANNEIKIATTIALAYRYKAKEKVGKSVMEYFGSLFMGFQKECFEGPTKCKTKVTFSISGDDADTIYELGQKTKKVDMVDIFEALITSHQKKYENKFKGD